MVRNIPLQRIVVLNTYWVGMSFMWNALNPIVLPALLLDFVPDARKNTYLGLLTFAGLVIAMIVQPLAGSLADGWKSKYGRRRPLMVAGTLLDFLFLAVLAWRGGLPWLCIGYLGLQLSSNTAQGPLQALLRDLVPENQLGIASSVKTFMDVLSLIAASLLAGKLLSQQAPNPSAIVLIIVVLLAICSAATILFAHEEPATARIRTNWAELAAQFKLDLQHHAGYWWLIGERGLFLLGVYGLQAFLQYYLHDVLAVADPPRQTGELLAAIAAGVLVLVFIGGWLTDRVGARRILYLASGITACGMLLLLFASSVRTLPLAGSTLGAGIGLFLSSNWALANRLSPAGQAGKFLGLTNVATAGSSALVRLQGPAIDALNAARPEAWLGYRGLFVFCTACILCSALLLHKIPAEQ